MKKSLINRGLYKELDILLWDNRSHLISRKEAFEVYENRFHYTHMSHLNQNEKALIISLMNEFGSQLLFTKNGILTVKDFE